MKYANIDNEIRTITGYFWISYSLTCSIDYKIRWYCIRNDTIFGNGLNVKRQVMSPKGQPVAYFVPSDVVVYNVAMWQKNISVAYMVGCYND